MSKLSTGARCETCTHLTHENTSRRGKKSLVVKGNPADALKAASDRGVVTLGTYRITSCDETVLTTFAPITKLQDWFMEQVGQVAPYPTGTLLQFS